MKDAAVAARRKCLEKLLGRFYRIDPNVPIRELDATLSPLWVQADKVLAALSGNQTIRFRIFR
jgi:hypothetical protein